MERERAACGEASVSGHQGWEETKRNGEGRAGLVRLRPLENKKPGVEK